MAIREIRMVPDPILDRVCEEVIHGTDVSHIVKDLKDTLSASVRKGVGLSANQIGYSVRIFIVDYKGQKLTLINPRIVPKSAKYPFMEESCLSVDPSIEVPISRPSRIIAEYYGEDWLPRRFKFDGFMARIIQHENDHLNGLTITGDRRDGIQKSKSK